MGTRLLLSTIAFLAIFESLLAADSDVGPEGVLEQSGNITIHAGKDTSIRCESGAGNGSVVTCLWLWEYPRRNGAPTVVAGFPGHGPTGTDCSINLVNVSQIQTGWWTCRAQTANSTILHTNPVFLQVFTSPVVTFELKPVNRTFSVGTTAELECKAAIPVQSCQWRFQQKGQTEALVVTEGQPKDGRDCSFKLEHVSYEQIGAWTCGARTDDSDQYTYTHTVYIQVEHKEEAFPVEFLEEPEDTEIALGQSGRLHCKVHEEAHIEDCRWYWQPVSHSKAWKVLMREFLPEDNDCSIEFSNVTADPEGLWVCHVKPIHSDKFIASKPAKLTVRGEATVSTLTRDISVSEGEPLSILCVAEQPAKACQWKRRVFDSYETVPNKWSLEEAFPSSGNELRDCSLHVEHALLEHQGLWICSIQFHDDQPFQETMPTAVTVKAPSIVRFVDPPRTQLAAEDLPVQLNCSTLSAVQECLWSWYEDDSKVAERVVKYNFTIDKFSNHDCSIVIPKVERSLQGFWQCGVRYGDEGYLRTSYARPFSLTVVKTGPITFRRVSTEAHVAADSSGLLECVVREPVEECMWLYQNDLHSPTQQFSRFEPKDFNNCSLRLSGNVSSGWWTCGARNTGDSNFTMASPIKVTIVHAGIVSTKSMIASDDMLVLVCQMPRLVAAVSCDWIHPSELNIFEFNNTEKYFVENNPNTGMCSVTFRPMLIDVGHWKCIFSVNNKNHILGEASFTVLSSPHNVRLSWIVGVLATVTLMLTVLLFVVITCRFYQCNRSNKATVQLNKPLPENNKRYSEDPTKGINFSFNESPELLVDFSIPNQDNHHYERVGRYVSQRPSFYQNVD